MRRGNRTNVAASGSSTLYQGRFPNAAQSNKRGPKHQAAVAASGGGSEKLDPYHNDELPCCQALQRIAQDILPAVVVAQKEDTANKDQQTTNNNSNNNHAESNNHSNNKTTTPYIPNSEGFLEMIREYLWNQFWLQRRPRQQHEESSISPTSAEAVAAAESKGVMNSSKKKRKKKKKKKTTNTTRGEAEEEVEEGAGSTNSNTMVSAVEDPMQPKGEDDKQSEQMAVALPEPQPEQAKAENNNNGDNTAENAEPQENSPVSMDLIQAIKSSLKRSSSSNPKETAIEPQFGRDWWVHWYLCRVVSSGNKDDTNQAAFPKDKLQLQDYLQVLGQKANFHDRRETDLNASDNKNDRPPSKNHPNNNSGASLEIHIQHKEACRIVERMECHSCRSRAANYISNATRIPLLPLDTMQSRKGDGRRFQRTPLAEAIGQHGDEDEYPFDYIAMEEGNAVRPNQNDYFEKEIDNDDAGAWLYLQAVQTEQGETKGWRIQKKKVPSSSMVEDEENHTEVLNEEDFAFLLREFVFLPGIGYDRLVGACDPASDQARTIYNSVHERYTVTMSDLTSCLHDLEDQQQKLNDNRLPESQRAALEGGVKSSILLNDCDGAVCSVLGKLLRIIAQICGTCQEVLLHWNETNAGEWVQSPLPSPMLSESTPHTLWNMYLNCVMWIQKAVQAFEEQLFPLADRHGRIPINFATLEYIQLHEKLVQNKLTYILKAVHDVMMFVDTKKDSFETPAKVYRPQFLRSLLTQQTLLKVVRPKVERVELESNKSLSSSDKTKALNDVCLDVLHELHQSMCATVRNSSIEHVKETYAGKRGKIERMLRNAKQLLDQWHSKQISPQDPKIDRSLLPTFLSQISSEDKTLDEALPVIRSQLTRAVESMVAQWISVTTSPNPARSSLNVCAAVASTPNIPAPPPEYPVILPLRLIQKISSNETNEVHSHGSRCQGVDGSFRVTCVIMTLFFSWLVEKFNEWQAELAEQELLKTMGDDLDIDLSPSGEAPTQTTAGKKKPKKKKNKGGPAASDPKTSNSESKIDKHSNGAVSVAIKTKDVGVNGLGGQNQPTEEKNDLPEPQGVGFSDEKVQEGAIAQVEPDSSSHASRDVAEQRKEKDDGVVDSEDEESKIKAVESPSTETISTAATTKSSPLSKTNFEEEQTKEGELPTRSTQIEGGVELKEVQSGVGVMDGSTFVPAQEFLLQRFLEVVEGKNDGKPLVILTG